MQFREHQLQAHSRSAWLIVCFFALLLVLCGFVNLVLGLGWRLLVPFAQGYPALFFETNTALIMLFVIGGSLVELHRLQDGGGPRVARWVGGQEVTRPDDALHRRLLNVVDEMALASGQPVPRVFVLPREDAINAFVAGWGPQDLSLCVTRGALERLTRAELQGLVAHEFSHIGEGDTRLNMRLVGMVFGLEMLFRMGQSLFEPDTRDRRMAASLIGLAIMAAGWLGWVAGHALQAAVSRQREHLADARAVQWTRSRDGLGGVLRKILTQQNEGVETRTVGSVVQHMLLVANESGKVAGWFDSHPPLPERIRRIYGRNLGPLPLHREADVEVPPPAAAPTTDTPGWTLV